MDSLNNNTSEYSPPQPQGPQIEQQISRHMAIPSNDAMNVNNNASQPVVIEGEEDSIIAKKRRKTSKVWKDFEEVQLADGVKKAVCLYCKEKLATGGRGASTSHLKRHSAGCLECRLFVSRQNKQTTLQFSPSESGINPFIVPGTKYSNEKMREILATAIMVHERPFSMVEDDVLIWASEYANPDFRKVSRKTARSDCLKLYEDEKNTFKKILQKVSKVSITIDMWKSSHQVAEYMVVTGHFVDDMWNLQKRVLSFVKVPAPRRGVDIANAIFKCLRSWGILRTKYSRFLLIMLATMTLA
ncbi:hypothetical protein QN277_006065 [Acacia crassicarpa]|uniref:BED-type domain-containing protein n=1 Tax=Acacia crassicarpa TaxID=499986 RepID=A0AAE1IXI8_9FABA|nr:hypothetical protein QN277_006065 [Acacia crassicarpa]